MAKRKRGSRPASGRASTVDSSAESVDATPSPPFRDGDNGTPPIDSSLDKNNRDEGGLKHNGQTRTREKSQYICDDGRKNSVDENTGVGDGQIDNNTRRKRKRTRKKKPQSSARQGDPQGAEDREGVGSEVDARSRAGGSFSTGVTDAIYVEGIPWTCNEVDVRDFFKSCGKINEVRLPRWQDSGRLRGYAHVLFSSAKAARAAFSLDGQYLKGRYLTVQAPQEPAIEKARRANRTAEKPRGCRTVFIKNLPYDADEHSVSEALAGCGKIASVRLAVWNHTRKLKGFGYVEFVSERGAETCVRTQDQISVGGRPVVIDFETGAPKGSFRRQDGAQIKKTSADAGVGKGKAPRFKAHLT